MAAMSTVRHFLACCNIQGDDAVHDAVRIRQLETGVPRRVAAALRNHGTGNDDVLWAALFTLAVLVRDDSVVYARAASALVSAGVFKVGAMHKGWVYSAVDKHVWLKVLSPTVRNLVQASQLLALPCRQQATLC